MARDTNTRTTWKARSPTCSACPTIYAIASTTGQPTKASKSEFVSAWRRSNACALRPPNRLHHAQRKNLSVATTHLLGVKSSLSEPGFVPEGPGLYGHSSYSFIRRFRCGSPAARRASRRSVTTAEGRAEDQLDSRPRSTHRQDRKRCRPFVRMRRG